MNEAGGTAAGSRLPGIEFSGKTGSAQVISNQGLQRAGRQAELKDNAWFVGFAPRRNAEIVVSVLVQGGEHGASAAAPIARDIVKAYYDKKNGKQPLEPLTTSGPSAPAVASVVLAHTGGTEAASNAAAALPAASGR